MAPRNKQQIDFKGYLQITLSEVDIPLITQAAEDTMPLVLELENCVRDGYRLTIVPDLEAKAVKAMLQDVRTDRTSCGWMLTGEGPNLWIAVAALLFKHVHKVGKIWTPFLTEAKEANRIR
jgi:hypothetical protein